MKILYLDCSMGAAGDMLLSALTPLTGNADAFVEKLNKLGIPHVRYEIEAAEKCGIVGTHIKVIVCGETLGGHTKELHRHSTLADMKSVIQGLSVSEGVKEKALSAFRLIAEAESRVHGSAVDEIHFHEVGTLDAAADIVGVCLAMEEIGADEVCASAVSVGSGFVHCAHGILPVPAPATAEILKGVPISGGGIEGELCTPTGAALLKTFVSEFGAMPEMTLIKTGCGMGTRDYARANCLRALLGEADTKEHTTELVCNIDDMTAEDIAFAAEKILSAGAKDVYTAPIYMKKSRQGTLLSVLCGEEEKEKFLRLIFKYTSTIGVREYACERHLMARREFERDTKYGAVRFKRSEGYGSAREKAEFDDIARIAREEGASPEEVRKNLLQQKLFAQAEEKDEADG